ncbi:hypothetical protein MOPEL_135_01770 [Mobilicoccus pelagius NBRC 104925]|uniref:Copper resistance protein D domain-containing protein n=2 Tax=Mobilicoccus TaxID=984996 RepID=H5UW31_9MICO|nr:hypothetical protein MOPEL_135_01770 [Mobilicoccus pelagius NBRC 104925]
MALAGAVGGIFAPLVGFDDGGALARWGVPVSRVILDVSASATIGLLLLAGTIVPERVSTDRRRAACRIAVVTGSVWVVASLAVIVFAMSNISGVSVTDPTFGGQLASALDFDYFRAVFISALVAVGATLCALASRTTTGMTWGAVLGLVALLVLSLTGHSGGAAAHDTAVNSLAVHLAASAVWLGGLIAVVVLRPVLGVDLPVVVERYSALAIWAYGGVVVSGVLNASLRIARPADLLTPYGMLLCAKVVTFFVLGVAGWRMRDHLIGRLEADHGDSRAFATLAGCEIALMALAQGVAVAMSRTAPPISQEASPDVVTSLTGYPDPGGPLEGLDWFTVWRPDWIFLAASILAVGLYLAGVLRLHRRGDSWPVHRTILWTLGWLAFVWTTSGAPGVYGRLTFSAHMVMHMMLTMGGPVIMAFGAPLTLASRTLRPRKDKTLGPREILLATAHSRWMNFWANPVVAGFNFAGSLYIFYFTHLFDLALRTHTGHVIMIVHFMLAGYVFAWSLVGVDPGPRRWPPSLRLVLLFATMSFHAFFGVVITSMSTLLGGDYFRQLNLPWVGDLMADQEKGGLITWGIGEFPMLVLALLTLATWMKSEEHEAKRHDRQAARDHDAALEAYNASLRQRGEALRRAEEAEEARYRARHEHAHRHGGSHHPDE